MATGPEHYREAERLLAEQHTCRVMEDGDPTCPFCVRGAARAQVHATLALAAATALSGVVLTLPQDSNLAADWNVAIGAAS